MKPIGFLPVLVAGVLAVAGCGGDDNGGGASSGSPSSSSAGQAKLDVRSSPPTRIAASTALSGKPDKKTFTYLQNELPTSAIDAVGYKEAAAALGWDFKVVNIKTTSPGPGMQQAIDSGTDFIAVEALPTALFANQLKAAKAKGIPVLSCFAPDKPDPKGTGLYSQCAGDSTIYGQAQQMARWAINDAGGKAHVALVNLRDIPTLVAEEQGWKDTLDKECSDCSLDVIPITAEALGKGSVPQQVVSYVQQHPDTNYVAFAFGDAATGSAEALAAGGLDKDVKIVGISAMKANLQAMADADQRAWTMQSVDYVGWSVVDLAARISQGMPLGDLATADVPTWVNDSPDTARDFLAGKGYWDGPQGFRDKFQQLWQLSS